jgi:hypothetical protein
MAILVRQARSNREYGLIRTRTADLVSLPVEDVVLEKRGNFQLHLVQAMPESTSLAACENVANPPPRPFSAIRMRLRAITE